MEIPQLKESAPLHYVLALGIGSVVTLSLAKFTNWRKLHCVLAGSPLFVGVAVNHAYNYYANRNDPTQRVESAWEELDEALTSQITKIYLDNPNLQDDESFVMFTIGEGDQQITDRLSLRQVRSDNLTTALRNRLTRLQSRFVEGNEELSFDSLKLKFNTAWNSLSMELTENISLQWSAELPSADREPIVTLLNEVDGDEIAFTLSLWEVRNDGLVNCLQEKIDLLRALREARGQCVELQRAIDRLQGRPIEDDQEMSVNALQRKFIAAWDLVPLELRDGTTREWTNNGLSTDEDSVVAIWIGERTEANACRVSVREARSDNLADCLAAKLANLKTTHALEQANQLVEELRQELSETESGLENFRERLQQILITVQTVCQVEGLADQTEQLLTLLNPTVLESEEQWNVAKLDAIKSQIEDVIQTAKGAADTNHLLIRFKTHWDQVPEDLKATVTYRTVDDRPVQGYKGCIILEKEGQTTTLTVDDVNNMQLNLILEWELTKLQDPSYEQLRELISTRYAELASKLQSSPNVKVISEDQIVVNGELQLKSKLKLQIEYFPTAVTPREMYESHRTTSRRERECPKSYFTPKRANVTIGDLRQMTDREFKQRYSPMLAPDVTGYLANEQDWESIVEDIKLISNI